jgi:hypothetical protein
MSAKNIIIINLLFSLFEVAYNYVLSLAGRLDCLQRYVVLHLKIPDVRDGLTREERVVLYVLHETQKERGDRNVPTAMLWGRVCEHFYISPEELSAMLARLGARK